MKKLSFLSAIVLVAFSMLFMGCSKDDENEDNKPDPVSKVGMTAKVNGENWESANFGCVVADGVPVIAGDCVGEFDIVLTVGTFAEGTYSLNASFDNFAIITDSLITYTTLGEMQSAGSVEITAIDTEKELISGTFEFVAIDLMSGNTIEVTEGQFTEVPYIEEITPVADNEFHVDIDGEPFIAEEIYADTFMDFIMISAENADYTEQVVVSMPEDISEGTYTIEGFGTTGQYNVGDDILMMSDSGTLEITLHDVENRKIEGTFEFEASDMMSGESASLTNGSFSVVYE